MTTFKEHIEKEGDHYKLVSKKTGKNLGTAKTKAGIEKREREVEYFKHQHESVENNDVANAKDSLKDEIEAIGKYTKQIAECKDQELRVILTRNLEQEECHKRDLEAWVNKTTINEASDVEKHIHNLASPNKAVRKRAQNALKAHVKNIEKKIKKIKGIF